MAWPLTLVDPVPVDADGDVGIPIARGFAATPGTVPSREEFRGTGGSLYYLRVQDLLEGSERLRIELRDKASGLVTGVVHLRTEGIVEISILRDVVAQD